MKEERIKEMKEREEKLKQQNEEKKRIVKAASLERAETMKKKLEDSLVKRNRALEDQRNQIQSKIEE